VIRAGHNSSTQQLETFLELFSKKDLPSLSAVISPEFGSPVFSGNPLEVSQGRNDSILFADPNNQAYF
jgi:hypothetical protein